MLGLEIVLDIVDCDLGLKLLMVNLPNEKWSTLGFTGNLAERKTSYTIMFVAIAKRLALTWKLSKLKSNFQSNKLFYTVMTKNE